MAQPKSFKIFCILESEKTNPQRAFDVDIEETKTVHDLKKAIRENVQELTKYDAHAIVLYYTSIPGDKNFAENAKIAQQTELAMPMDELVEVFPTGPQKGTVQIIVQPPPESTALPDQQAHVLRSPIAEDGVIMGHLTRYQPDLIAAITHYLKDDVQLPIWQPQSCSEAVGQHIASLKIPKISASSPTPSLLLHNLGQPSYDAELTNRVDRLFGPGSYQRFLCNTSGSGKTRLLLEGLCRYWGLYFTARTQPDGVGSSDLENILGSLEEFSRLTAITNENSKAAHAANLDVTSRRFHLVLYVRLLVLRMFLECASSLPGGITEQHRSRWLLIQLAPTTLLGRDFFAELNRVLVQISPTYLLSSLQIELNEVKKLLGPQEPALFCVLDEAQIPTSLFSDCFLSETMSASSRPTLRQLMISWMSFVPNLIVSGTGISMQEPETVLSFAVGKEDGAPPSETITEVGGFDDEKDQQAYLESYVPPGYLKSEVGKEVLPRVGYWLRGRHRFTATYISRLLQAGFESPHTVLDDFVHSMTNFRPSDRPDDSAMSNCDLRSFDFSKLRKDEILLRQVAGCIFEYIFNGKPRDLGGPVNQKLVEYGVARFANNLKVKVDEPLALLAATNLFNNETVWGWRHFLVDSLCNANESARGIAFEQLGTYLLGLAFSSPRPLSEVFQFVGDNRLKDQVARLVAIHKEGRESACSPVDILSAASTSTYILGRSTNTAEETLAWIKDPNVVRVAVQFKQRMESTMGPEKTEEALRTTDPEEFLSQRLRTSTQAAPPVDQHRIPNLELSQDLRDALGDLGRGADNAGELSVLRVLIPFPAVPNAQNLAQLAETDSSHHLVATVDLPSLARQHPEQQILLSLKLRLEAAAHQRKKGGSE